MCPVWRLRSARQRIRTGNRKAGNRNFFDGLASAEGQGRRLHRLQAARGLHADGVRRRRREGRLDAGRGGAGFGGGPAGRALRRPGRQAARQHAGRDRAQPRQQRLYRQRAEVPAAGQPQSGAGRSGQVLAAPAAADRTDPAEADRRHGPLRRADPARDGCHHRQPARQGAPVCRGAPHRHLPPGLPAAQFARQVQGLGRLAFSQEGPSP